MEKALAISLVISLLALPVQAGQVRSRGGLSTGTADQQYLRRDNGNAPTAAYTWTTDLTTTGNIYLSSLTAGSIPYIGASGVITQNNAYLFWDGTNNYLGINNNSPTVPLDVTGAAKISGALDMSSQKITALATPTDTTDACTKAYADSLIVGTNWQDAVISFLNLTTSEPASPSTGDRYINTATGNSSQTTQAVTINYIYEWDGSSWTETVVADTMTVKVTSEGKIYTYNATDAEWKDIGAATDHNSTLNLQGGTTNEYYHATEAEHNNWFIKNIDDTDDILQGSTNKFYTNALVDAQVQASDYIITGTWTYNNLVTCANTPTGDNHLARKKYIDDLLGGFTWQEPVIDKDLTTPPVSPTLSDRYIISGTAVDWYNSSWGYRQLVTIDNTKVAGDESSFPVYIKISGANGVFTNALASGHDILFTSSDGTTKIPYQREEYDAVGQVFVAWVKADITGAADTELYMYYGNAGSSDQQDADNTWDANYEAVYHFNESSGNPYDSTSNSNDGANYGATHAATGKIGDCFSFDGSNDYVDTNYTTSLSGTSDFTVSAWMKADSTSEVYGISQAHTMGGYTSDFIFNYNTSTYLMWMRSKIVNEPGGYDYSIWNYLQMVWDMSAGTYEVYVNGASIGTSAVVSGYGGINSIKIATRGDATSSFWGGDIEEVRISNTIRSANWISTSYANQNSPSTFFSLGAEESPTASGAWAGHINDITEWDGANWTFSTPSTGWSLIVTDEGKQYTWNGAAWVAGTAIVAHNDTTGKQGGQADQYYHFTTAEHTELTQWLDDVTLSDGGSMNIGAGDFDTTGDMTVNDITSTDGAFRADQIIADGTGTHPNIPAGYVELYMLSTTGRIFCFDGSNYQDLAIGDWNGGDPNIMLKTGGDVGINEGTPLAKMHIGGDLIAEKTTGNQIEAQYDTSNYLGIAVDVTGDAVITATGGDISFDDENVSLTGILKAGYDSQFGDAGDYWKIEEMTLGGQTYPMLGGYSASAYGNVGAIKDALIIYGSAADPILYYSNSDGTSLNNIYSDCSDNKFVFSQAVSVNGAVTSLIKRTVTAGDGIVDALDLEASPILSENNSGDGTGLSFKSSKDALVFSTEVETARIAGVLVDNDKDDAYGSMYFYALATGDTSATKYLELDSTGQLLSESGKFLATAGASGVVTLGGIGTTNNENLTLDFETTANTVEVGSGTGVTTVDFNALEVTAEQITSTDDISMTGRLNCNDYISGLYNPSLTGLIVAGGVWDVFTVLDDVYGGAYTSKLQFDITNAKVAIEVGGTDLWSLSAAGTGVAYGGSGDTTLTFSTGAANTGVFYWDHSEDMFVSNDYLKMPTNRRLLLRDTAIGIYSYADTFADHFADGGMRFGDSSAGAPTNYSMFASDGILTMAGTARVIKSRWFPFNALKAPGTKPATFKELGISGVWEFSDATDDTVVFNLQIPNDMDLTVALSFNIGWSTNTAVTTETCTWQFEYLYSAVGEDTTLAAQETLTVDSNAVAQSNGMILAEITGIDLPGASDVCMHCRLKRLGAGGNDDLTDTAELHGVCIKYTSHKLGLAT